MGVCPDALYDALDQDLSACPCSGTYQAAVSTLRKTILKKFVPKGGNSQARERALSGFRERASYCRLLEGRFMYARGFIRRTLGYLEADEVADGVRYSNGSSLHMPLKSTSAFTKHNLGPVSVSSDELYKEYMGLLRDTNPPLFRDAVLREYFRGSYVVTPQSRIVTVPKTRDIDRVIAVEPTVNAFLQQGVKFCIERRLASVGIDLTTQPVRNRELARRGSLGYGLATIDLSNASDSISRELLSELLPPDWRSYIALVSTPSFSLDGDVYDAQCIALTMGNAITFPLQTLIFLALCYETYARMNIPFNINENVAVFGDDIIVEDRMYDYVCATLTRAGFDVNSDKSFGEGEFRESCGADWFSGINIRGVYIKRLDTTADHYVARNLLAAWSFRWGIPLESAIGLLDKYLLVRHAWNPVPPHASMDAGIRVFTAPSGAYRNWSYHYKILTKQYKKRLAPKLHEGAHIQGTLAGSLQRRHLCERPSGKGKSAFIWTSSPYWGVVQIESADAWVYDESRTTAGL